MNTPPSPPPPLNHNVLAVILGGGQGTRLFPLTKFRSKPAVPVGGKYRLVDIPISNCINSGYKQIYLLTQFNSTSLHRHISQSYKFDHFSRGFVEILAAQQTLADAAWPAPPNGLARPDTGAPPTPRPGGGWYQGTADAVRKNLVHFTAQTFDYMLILSGDQLYRMDYRQLIAAHVESRADVTVATVPVRRADVPGFGIMQMDADNRIVRFVEKPRDPAVQDTLRLDRGWYPRLGLAGDEELFLASMGIYVFNRAALLELLESPHADFGRHIIPAAIQTHRVCGYVFQGYWEDIGTIRAFFEANLELAKAQPRFSFFDIASPIFTHPRFLPASRIDGGVIEGSLVADGCVLEHADIRDSLLGLRSRVNPGSRLRRTVMMGSDYYEPPQARRDNAARGLPPLGIGRNTRIENAIIDKNARIGENCLISPAGKPPEADHPLYYIRDGIVIIPKNAVVPDGTVI